MIFEQSAGSSGQCRRRELGTVQVAVPGVQARAAAESITDPDAIQRKVGSGSIADDGGWPVRNRESWGRLG